MKTAVVLGATGLVGRHLVEQLDKSAHISKVVAITRRAIDFGSDKVLNQVVDFEHLTDHREIFRGDLLFSSLGTTAKKAGSYENHRKVDYDYQLQVAQLAVENGVQHYLLVSSGGASSQSKNGYSRMKGELDEKVVTLGFPRVSIFKPSLLLGAREEHRFLEGVGSYLLPVLGVIPGLRKYRPIKGTEVAAKMVQVSTSEGEGVEEFFYDEIFL